jgi:hypothetical protein
VFLVPIACARGVRRRSDDPGRRDLAQALTAAVAVPMVTFLTFDGFAFSVVAGFTFVVIGCCGALRRLSTSEAAPPVATVHDLAPLSSR